MTSSLVFGKWDISEVRLSDPGLEKYVCLEGRLVLHNMGRHSSKQFEKSNVPIIERLMNAIMRSGSGRKVGGKTIRGRGGCGKKMKAWKIVEGAFEIIYKRTKENPVQVFITALENSAPREETTRVRMGGVTRHIAVDVAPQRRIDFALRNIGISTVGKSFDRKKSAPEALADELIAASNSDNSSMAIARKNEIERIAKGAR
jgi:small subunit ribosomal protein S7